MDGYSQFDRDTKKDVLAFMPEQPGLDTPGVLPHVVGRGIARIKIFRTDSDRGGFLERLAALCRDGHLRG